MPNFRKTRWQVDTERHEQHHILDRTSLYTVAIVTKTPLMPDHQYDSHATLIAMAPEMHSVLQTIDKRGYMSTADAAKIQELLKRSEGKV